MKLGSFSATPAPSPLRLGARMLRKATRRFRNHLLWFYLRMRNLTARRAITGSTPVAVSMTTYGRRINAAAIAIESITRGRSRPSRITLWLDDPELYAALPAALRRLQRRGLEISLTDNLGPHTKYFPYVESVQEHCFPLVTADDDIMYPRYWLSRLYDAHLQYPASVNCHWASRMILDDGKLNSYHTWPNCKDTEPRFSNFGLGVSGIIYPPEMLAELARHGAAFRELSPTADDVWLHWVALRSDYPVRQISPTPRHFALIPGTQAEALMKTNNVEGSGNDAWIHGLYTENDRSKIAGVSSVVPAFAGTGIRGRSPGLLTVHAGNRPILQESSARLRQDRHDRLPNVRGGDGP